MRGCEHDIQRRSSVNIVYEGAANDAWHYGQSHDLKIDPIIDLVSAVTRFQYRSDTIISYM